MSKSAISDAISLSAGVITWRLALTFWVGGMWMFHFVLLPMLEQAGMASLLVEGVADRLRPALVGFAAFCAVLQLWVLWLAEGRRAVLGLRGQLLFAVLGLALLFFLARHWWPAELFWQLLGYLGQAFCGLLLVLQAGPAIESVRNA